LANRFGFIKAITERWKVDGRNIFWSFRGFRIHNGAFEVLIENIVSTSIQPQTHHYDMKTLEASKEILVANFRLSMMASMKPNLFVKRGFAGET
jgi:hypothetical protein